MGTDPAGPYDQRCDGPIANFLSRQGAVAGEAESGHRGVPKLGHAADGRDAGGTRQPAPDTRWRSGTWGCGWCDSRCNHR